MISDDLVAAMEPWITPDFEVYLRGIGSMFAQVEAFASDNPDTGEAGWTVMLDPDRCPPEALAYLAQWVGEKLPVGVSVAEGREWIKDNPNSIRGTVQSIFLAAQRSLTGQRTVSILERSGSGGGDDPDRLVVHTYVDETPDSNRVLQDLLDVAPADIVLVYQSVTGQTWGEVKLDYPLWHDVQISHSNWDQLRGEIAGATTWTRPRTP